eukprot:CAMPEP_0182880550 /NCGR_PEP_ID=MMETSP0034_2-20130328/16631_1 /TAXON_ID=156128 /ORGANISM="Nephroselmis pyriformis, Strain CCMP717" /LENGTH=484 /DNA_ID=CAMNT_0025013543 /DNA_START=95 /DNA_END=1545 /DNA_ORIENTATION=+
MLAGDACPRGFVPWDAAAHKKAVPYPGRKPDSVVSKLSEGLISSYISCNEGFLYSDSFNPKRVLTKPAEGVSNDGHDNANADLILSVNDTLSSNALNAKRYVVRDMLGSGTFGGVYKCVEASTGEVVAVKIIKNHPAYYHQARVEIGVLQLLNNRCDPEDEHHIVRMLDFFVYKGHLCLVFELLSANLYELIRHNQFRGLSLNLLRTFLNQLLDSLQVLRAASIMHCDIKPENILLKSLDSGEIKLIDFGSACFENRTVYSYIQSRFYRSPEVLLGHPYGVSIDMWSVGCVAAELFLGLPLFPGASEYDVLARMVDAVGPVPDAMLQQSVNAHKYFKLAMPGGAGGGARSKFALFTPAECEAHLGTPVALGKKYFPQASLDDIVGARPFREDLSEEALTREKRGREALLDFLHGVMEMDPLVRWSPDQAAGHPFLTGEPFTGPYQPPPPVQRPADHAHASRGGLNPRSVGVGAMGMGGQPPPPP